MSLVQHLRAQDWSALEDAWTELMVKEGHALDEVRDALDWAADRRKMGPCVGLVKEHAGLLAAADRNAEAAELLGRTMLGGGSPGELASLLWESAKAAWGEEPWWDHYVQMSAFEANAPDMRESWKRLRKLIAMAEGAAVHHAKGWGTGLVTRLDRDALEVDVRFVNGGRKDTFPLSSAADIFEVLEPEDLRSLLAREPEELKRRVKEEPLEMLRSILRRYQGRCTQPMLKTAMGQVGIDGAAFTAWWKKTRKEADTSEWYEITGTGTKAQVRMLAEAADPAENMRRQLRRAPELRLALQRVREVLRADQLDGNLREAALSTLEELVQDEAAPLPVRLSCWLLLRDERGKTPHALMQRVAQTSAVPRPESPAEMPALWTLFNEVPAAREQERCVDLLREAFPGAAAPASSSAPSPEGALASTNGGESDAEQGATSTVVLDETEVLDEGEASTGGDSPVEPWLLEAERNLHHAPPGMVRPLIEELLQRDRKQGLCDQYSYLIARLKMNPAALIRLSELVEEGTLIGEFPNQSQRAQALLQLSTYLLNERTTPHIARARTRLAAFLTSGSPPLLRRMLDDLDRAGLKSVLGLVQRGVDDALESVFTELVIDKHPDIFSSDEGPFWAADTIWTTREGLARQQAELRELMDVKIPANSEAIGKAAALGDLSENSEWESAIEEQRNLTARASALQEDLERAALLEDAALPEDTACPGTRVTYKDLSSGESRSVRLLGPWDAVEDDIISYRSPLAQGMLGLGPGDTAKVTLPSGQIELEVQSVEALTL